MTDRTGPNATGCLVALAVLAVWWGIAVGAVWLIVAAAKWWGGM